MHCDVTVLSSQSVRFSSFSLYLTLHHYSPSSWFVVSFIIHRTAVPETLFSAK